MEQPKPHNEPQKSIASLSQRVLYFLLALWRRIENTVFVLAIIFVALYFILQLSVVQNWLIQKVSARLSDDLKTKVAIQHIDFEFFDNLVLDGLYIEDQKGDTLIYAQQLTAGLNANIFTLFSNKLEFTEIALSKARIYLKRPEGEYDTNIQFLLDYFASDPNKPKKAKKSFPIRIQNLELEDVVLERDNQVRGEKMVFEIPEGRIKVNKADLPSKIVHIQHVNLEGIRFTYLETPPKPMPPKPKAETPPDSTKKKSAPTRFIVEHFALHNSWFKLDNFEASPVPSDVAGVMDFDHILVEKVDFLADSVHFDSDLSFSGILKEFNAKEKCGFELVKSRAEKVVVNDSMTALYHAKVATAGSLLGDTIILWHKNKTYRDYRKFNNNIMLDLRLGEGSKIKLGDITKFSNKLAKNKFFQNNFETVADISGDVGGTVNDLKGRKLNIKVGKKAFLKGKFEGIDMARDPDLMRITFNFDRLQSDIQTVKDIIPGFNPPQYFTKLGNLAFEGEYMFLFGKDHLARGKVYTDVGSGDLDMKLDMKDATYSGDLNMNRFNLREWTGNKDLQYTTFKIHINEGSKGLSLGKLNTGLKGSIDTLVFKGYTYKNIDVEGLFKEKMFDGKLKINDPNMKIKFDGRINLRDSITSYRFSADIDRVDLGALNLVDKDLVLSTKIREINLRAGSYTDITGKARLEDFALLQDNEIMHRLDSLVFISNYADNGRKYFAVITDIANAYMEGVFNLATVPRNLQNLLVQQYPKFARQLNIAANDSVFNSTDNYKIQLAIRDSRDFTRLLNDHIGRMRNVVATAYVNAPDRILNLGVNIPHFAYDSNYVERVDVLWSSIGNHTDFNLSIPRTYVSKRILPSFQLSGSIQDDDLNFKFFTQKTDTSKNAIVGGLRLDGVLNIAEDSLWQVKFGNTEIALFNQNWTIEEDNYARFNGRRFYAKNFELFNADQRIAFRELNENKGVFVSFTNFDLSAFNPYIRPKQLKLEGLFDFDITVQQIYTFENIDVFLNSGTLKINNVVYGDLFGNVVAKDIKSPVWWRFFINNDETKSQLRFAGVWSNGLDSAQYFVPELGVSISKGEDIRNTTTAYNFPLQVVETFIPGISKTAGNLNADIAVEGKFNALKMNGQAHIVKGQTQLDYLKAMFHMRDQKITITERKIWVDKAEIWDAEVDKNMAIVNGGLHHQFFKKWRVDCSITSQNNRFMVLNTGPKDNELFYGQGIGKFKAEFSGSFSSTNMFIEATTGPNTRLFIPLSGESDIKDSTFFVQFRSKNPAKQGPVAVKKPSNIGEIKGLNFEMDLTITEEAEVQLIFDEQAGDIIKGRGVGGIKMDITPTGAFYMYGNYTIKRGEYLFTLLNFVNKPFVVTEGGTISWSGDPFGAKINIDATYQDNTPIINLVRDELLLLESTQPELLKDASRGTRTIVTMRLKDDLMKPTITFDLEFPDISSQLRTVTENKLRQLRQDQNELTRQVFGLIVIGSFLPENTAFIQNGDYGATVVNTLTQLLSTQLSNYLTGIASTWFGDNVSSLDFRVAYNDYQSQLANNQGGLAARELQVQLSGGFINDRVTIRIGSEFGFAQPNTNVQDGFLGQDITIEIQPTQNRQWRLKVYQRTEPDLGGGSRRARYGVGVTFRQEYDSFTDMMGDLGRWFKGK